MPAKQSISPGWPIAAVVRGASKPSDARVAQPVVPYCSS